MPLFFPPPLPPLLQPPLLLLRDRFDDVTQVGIKAFGDAAADIVSFVVVICRFRGVVAKALAVEVSIPQKRCKWVLLLGIGL